MARGSNIHGDGVNICWGGQQMFTQNIGPICCGQCYSFQFYHPVFYNEKVIILSEGSGGGSFASHDCSLSCLLLPPIGGVGKSHPSTASPLPPFSCLEHHSVTSPSPDFSPNKFGQKSLGSIGVPSNHLPEHPLNCAHFNLVSLPL